VLVAVNIGESRAMVASFLKETGLDVPVVLDPDSQVTDRYFVTGVPTLVLIGKDGTIQLVLQGYGKGLEQKTSAYIEKLLAGESLLAPAKGGAK
jgi:hypothetical protein